MCLSKDILFKIIGENKRFCDPYDNPESYYIWSDAKEKTDIQFIDLYYKKLEYAVCNANNLIEGAFDNEFYNFYGVNRSIVKSPYEMCSELYFDSFVLDIRDNSIGTCLTNEKFMFGHFIEVQWDNEWKIKSKWID